MNEMVSTCDVTTLSSSHEIICTRCSGLGLVNAEKTTVTEGVEVKTKHEYRSGSLYQIKYSVPVYHSKKTNIGTLCPVCGGAGHANR